MIRLTILLFLLAPVFTGCGDAGAATDASMPDGAVLDGTMTDAGGASDTRPDGPLMDGQLDGDREVDGTTIFREFREAAMDICPCIDDRSKEDFSCAPIGGLTETNLICLGDAYSTPASQPYLLCLQRRIRGAESCMARVMCGSPGANDCASQFRSRIETCPFSETAEDRVAGCFE